MPVTVNETRASLAAVCARKDLYDAAQIVSHAVSARSPLPILSHILLAPDASAERLRLSATDMELAISLSVPATLKSPSACTVSAKVLAELLGGLPDGEVELSVDHSLALRIKCDRSTYKLLGLPAEEYPSLPDVPGAHRFRISQERLRNAIRQTLFAVSTDEARSILTGVLLVLSDSTLTLVATDTHRLAMRRAPVAEAVGEHQVIVPARALGELQRLLTDAGGEVEVSISDTQVKFVTPSGITLVTRVVEGKFPDYTRVIPTQFSRSLTIPTQPFLRAVKRAMIVARNAAKRVILRTVEDKLTITAESAIDGTAYEEVEVVCEGSDVEMAFNGGYILDVLNVVETEGVRLDLSEPLRPGVLRPIQEGTASEDDQYLCVLMPMQIV